MENLRSHEIKIGDTLLLGLSQIPVKVLDIKNVGVITFVLTYEDEDHIQHTLEATRNMNFTRLTA